MWVFTYLMKTKRRWKIGVLNEDQSASQNLEKIKRSPIDIR